MELQIEYLPIDQIKPYDKNAREHREGDVQAIVNSIMEFGFDDPIGIWSDENIIVEGHGRLQAAKQLDIKEVPVIRLDHLTDEQRRAYALAHNKTAELSMWDFELLTDELDNIFDIDMADFGFDLSFDDEEPEVEEDEAPDVPEEPKAVLGDLYEMGGHRLICGDSTDITVIDRLMDGNKADMVFTDPPYGYKYESNHQDKYKMLENDDKILDYIPAIYGATNDDCAIYSFCGWQSLKEWLEYFENTDLTLKNIIVWKKNNWSMGDLEGAYAGQYEICLYLNKGRVLLNGKRDTDIWEFDREPPKLHPTMKPIELIGYALKKSSNKENNILDVFGGSGSTLIACEQLNRKCYMCELDPHYVDVIVQRYINLKGSDDDVFLIRDGKKIPYKEVSEWQR